MPAYFNLSVQFQRKDIYPLFVADFSRALKDAGFRFRGGYWNSERDSLERITAFNQEHLENNFQLGYTESYLYDYKQMLFEYGDYGEVRGFWMNNYPEEETFCFEIIVPESEMLTWEGKRIFIREAIREWVASAKKSGNFPM